MATKFGKVLDSVMLTDFDLKRKRTENGESNFTGAYGMTVPLSGFPNPSPRSLLKRQKLDGLRNKCPSFSFNHKKSLQRYYFNFKNSGSPQRIMYAQNGVWADLPQDVVELVKKEMQTKNAMVEVDIDGDSFLLDFLHMIRMHLKTGNQQPIAWVDEAGTCYFPESFDDDDNFDLCSHYEYRSDDHLVTENSGSNDLNLKLEIEISGSDIFKMESTGESNAIAAHVRVSHNLSEERLDAEDDISCVRDNVHVVEDSEVSKRIVDDVPKGVIPKEEHLDTDAVKEMFSSSIGSFVGGEIVALHCGSGALIEGRRELFQKQVDIVKRLRGDANVRYAWLPSSRGSVYSSMNYGLGCHVSSNMMSSYGIGVHLIPVSCTDISETLFDVDENGVGNVVLCRVIMGKMENVHPASKQFHQSSDDYDSGVDDLQSPKRYIVWSMNMNTHIYPEYAVSFKISSDSKGLLNGNRMDVSGVTDCSQVLQAQVLSSPLSGDLSWEIEWLLRLTMSHKRVNNALKVGYKISCSYHGTVVPNYLFFGYFNELEFTKGILTWAETAGYQRTFPFSCHKGGSCHQVSTEDIPGKSSSHLASRPIRLPKSPWMPFPVLLAAIASKVSEKDMQLVNRHYGLYQNKFITRGDFITKLRLTVGDSLLKSTLTSLQNKIPSQSQTGLAMPREPVRLGGF